MFVFFDTFTDGRHDFLPVLTFVKSIDFCRVGGASMFRHNLDRGVVTVAGTLGVFEHVVVEVEPLDANAALFVVGSAYHGKMLRQRPNAVGFLSVGVPGVENDDVGFGGLIVLHVKGARWVVGGVGSVGGGVLGDRVRGFALGFQLCEKGWPGSTSEGRGHTW